MRNDNNSETWCYKYKNKKKVKVSRRQKQVIKPSKDIRERALVGQQKNREMANETWMKANI